MEQPAHRILDLSKGSFGSLIPQLPAVFPTHWGNRSMESNEPKLPLVLCWDGDQLLVQITDDKWMTHLEEGCDSDWCTKLEHSQKSLPLNRMVILIHQLLSRMSAEKNALYGVWRNMQAALLLWAIEFRTHNMIEEYYTLFPVACIGECVTISKTELMTINTKDMVAVNEGGAVIINKGMTMATRSLFINIERRATQKKPATNKREPVDVKDGELVTISKQRESVTIVIDGEVVTTKTIPINQGAIVSVVSEEELEVTKKVVSEGYLSEWQPQKGISWHCDINNDGAISSIELPWDEPNRTPNCLRFEGEMGKLLGRLLRDRRQCQDHRTHTDRK